MSADFASKEKTMCKFWFDCFGYVKRKTYFSNKKYLICLWWIQYIARTSLQTTDEWECVTYQKLGWHIIVYIYVSGARLQVLHWFFYIGTRYRVPICRPSLCMHTRYSFPAAALWTVHKQSSRSPAFFQLNLYYCQHGRLRYAWHIPIPYLYCWASKGVTEF